ncbi:MAG: hypothetical protein ACP5GI_08165 [Sulfolobales archaeon]
MTRWEKDPPPITPVSWWEFLGVERKNVRTSTVRVDADPLFFRGELAWDKIKEINRRYYHKYKDILKVNAGQVMRKNDSDWRSFFKLLKLKKQGKLPPHIRKVSPPGYWKNRALGKRRLIILIRSDRYYVEKIREDWGYIVLKDFNKSIRYYGKILWSGKQGDLEIIYRGGRWVANIPVEVGVRPPKWNWRGYVEGARRIKKNGGIVERNPESIRQKDPRDSHKAFIDMGLTTYSL